MDNEIWKQFRDTSYEASNFGRIRSLKFNKEKILKQSTCDSGYFIIKFFVLKKPKRLKVSRVVYESFCGEIPEKYAVAHLDNNRKNNSISNLLACSYKENESHKKIYGTSNIGSRNGSSKLTEKQIPEIRLMLLKKVKISEIALMFKVSHYTIYDIKNKTKWTHVA